MFRFVLQVLRLSFVGALIVGVVAKLLLKSKAEPTTEEIDLVTIFEGNELVSSADPFYGGKTVTLFGGALLDLRKATPAPTGIHLDVVLVMGGFSLVVPKGWKVDFTGKAIGGVFDDATQTTTDPDAPVVRITGNIVLGGLQATTRSPVEAVN